MTNAEKFLKDGVDITNFASELSYYYEEDKDINKFPFRNIMKFLNEEIKPILTDDERVILRNIANEYELICREKGNNLKIIARGNGYTEFYEYNHLFQFIKENEEYSIEELLKGE